MRQAIPNKAMLLFIFFLIGVPLSIYLFLQHPKFGDSLAVRQVSGAIVELQMKGILNPK